MKKILVSTVSILVSVVMMMLLAVMGDTGVYAAGRKCVLTNTLGNAKCDANGEELERDFNGEYRIPSGETAHNCSCDEGKGESIKDILKLVVRIMSIGAGALAVLGVGIVGIQYLTSGGNEEQARKARRRLIELIIGIVAYVVMYALLSFLIPGFNSSIWL